MDFQSGVRLAMITNLGWFCYDRRCLPTVIRVRTTNRHS